MRFLLMTGPATPLRQDAAISGLKGRELTFLTQLLGDAQCGPDKKDHAPLVSKLARCVGASGRPTEIAAALNLAAKLKDNEWPLPALLDGFAGLVPAASKGAPAPRICFIVRHLREVTSRDGARGAALAGCRELRRARCNDGQCESRIRSARQSAKR
jgi:hypothetical protein